MKLLLRLAQRPGEVVSVDELLDSVWAGVVVSPESVYQYVAQLRKALGDVAEQPRYVATVPRKGYRLIATVAPEAEQVAAPIPDPAPPESPAAKPTPVPEAAPAESPATKPTATHRRRPSLQQALTGIALIAAVLAWVVPRSWWRSEVESGRQYSIAVMPFADLSADASNQAFCDGLAEEVLNSLAQLPDMRVVARTSSFSLRAVQKDARELGRRLNASHVVEGSVRRTADRVRVSVQLIDTGSGLLVWSESYDRPYVDTIEIQEQIAGAVIRSLQIRVPARTAARLATKPTLDIGAYELYWLARHTQRQRTPDAAARAIEYQLQAIQRDPAFALAHAGLADAYISQFNFGKVAPADLTARAQPAVDRALQLDPLLPEGHAAQGSLHTQLWNLEQAKASLQRALVLNPNFSDAHLRLGIALDYDGRPRAALESLRRAQRLDPLNFFVLMRECMALQEVGLYDEAIQQCDRSAELEPMHPTTPWVRGVVSAFQGRPDEALAHYRRAIALEIASPYAALQGGWLYMDIDQRSQALEMTALAERLDADGPQRAQVERVRLQAVDMKPGDIKAELDRLKLTDAAQPVARLAEASLRLIANDAAGAAGAVRGSLAEDPAVVVRWPSVFDLAWGWSSGMDLATVLMRSGRREEALRMLDHLDRLLDQYEENGLVGHGFYYLRAGSAALRDDDAAAFRSLAKARDTGWRRLWWARIDPAFAKLRDRQEFVSLLDSTSALLHADSGS
jgi:TolB-like protein/DNA-binding winged helix-turn-helix (wHTH) protein/Tfp pilus assembly protein PilF